MSAEGAETSEKNKLMEILEEELSALNLRKEEIDETKRNESKIHQNTEEIVVGDKQVSIKSFSDETAGVLHKTVDNKKEEGKIDNKAFDPPRGINEDILKQENDYEIRKHIITEKVLNHSSGVSVKQYLLQNSIDERKSIDSENEECKIDNKAFDPPRATNEDELRMKNDDRKHVFMEKVLNHSTGVAVTQYLRQKSIDENKSIDNENEECKIDNKAFDPPRATNQDIMKRKNDYENRKYVFTEKVQNHSSGVAVKQYSRRNNIDENKSIDNEEDFVPPSDSLAEKILRRAEFIFQDYNIFKNSYLLNLVRRNKKGFVSLKVITSLRKIKTLTKDYRVIAYSLMNSNILELNSEKTKVRRIEPIPKIETTNYGKTVMVFNMPQEILSNDSLKNFFSKFGTVISAGLYETNSPESNAYHKRCLIFHRKISSKTYGIVEFENYNDVVSVFKDGDGHLPKENDMKVVPLMPQVYKKERRYLKFVEQYNQYPRRGFGRFKSRGDFRAIKQEAPVRNEETGEIIKHGNTNMGTSNGGSGEVLRNEKNNTGSYYKRGYFRRPYRYRNTFAPSNSKNYIEGQANNDYYNSRNYRWEEGRHLKINNSMNIDRYYPNVNRKKPGYACVENGVQV